MRIPLPTAVASAEKRRRELGWKPEKNLERKIADAWGWHKLYPNGKAE